jgi:Uma2 family endonuclease
MKPETYPGQDDAMSSTTDLDPELAPTVADLIDRLDGIAPRRILLRPTPGTATEADLLRVLQRGRQLCELVDGTLVEKCMGAREANLAAWIIRLLGYFTDPQNLGELFGSDGPFRLLGGLVRLPDVTFIRREKLPGGQVPAQPILELAPDLAIEVLSEGNTPGEMQRKRREYFLAGTSLVWEVDPRRRVVTVYTGPEEGQTRTVADTLDGGTVLPELSLPVTRIFERLPPEETPPPRSRKKRN